METTQIRIPPTGQWSSLWLFIQLCCMYTVDEIGVFVGCDEYFWTCINLFCNL